MCLRSFLLGSLVLLCIVGLMAGPGVKGARRVSDDGLLREDG